MPHKNPEENKAYHRSYYGRHKEKFAAWHKRYNDLNRADKILKLKRRKYNLAKLYSMTLEDYDALLEKQGGHCAFCLRRPEEEHHGRLHIDHDHGTNEVRGLLCARHNVGLAAVGDSIENIRVILSYLEKNEALL